MNLKIILTYITVYASFICNNEEKSSKKKFSTISHENFLIIQEALKNQTINKKENFPRNDSKILDFSSSLIDE